MYIESYIGGKPKIRKMLGKVIVLIVSRLEGDRK